MVNMTYRVMAPCILSFLGRLIRTASFTFRNVTSIWEAKTNKNFFFLQKTDFYNCRPVGCGHIVCANLSDDPKAVYDDLKSLDLQLYWRGVLKLICSLLFNAKSVKDRANPLTHHRNLLTVGAVYHLEPKPLNTTYMECSCNLRWF